MRRKLLISLGAALYLAAFVVGGMETVAHTDGNLVETLVCGSVIGLAAAMLFGAIVYGVGLAASGWWDWVRAG